jgi:hypothetical protein
MAKKELKDCNKNENFASEFVFFSTVRVPQKNCVIDLLFVTLGKKSFLLFKMLNRFKSVS